jgi:FkbM family methyltransferase
LSARLLKSTFMPFPRRVRGHAAKHLASRSFGSGFVYQTPDRGMFPIHNNIWDASRYLEIFELDETAFLRSILHPGMTVTDVGANVGWYTALFVHMVGPTGKVLSIEPGPSNIARLKELIEVNGYGDRIQLKELAVADKPGVLTLFLNKDSGANTIVSELGSHYGARSDGKVDVKVETLDSVIAEAFPADLPIDLLKIDVERAELAVLQGAAQLLSSKRVKALYIEVTDVREKNGVNQAYLLNQLLMEHGYTGRACVHQGQGRLEDKLFVPTESITEEGPWRNVYYTLK